MPKIEMRRVVPDITHTQDMSLLQYRMVYPDGQDTVVSDWVTVPTVALPMEEYQSIQ